jgi:hypothetical protein
MRDRDPKSPTFTISQGGAGGGLYFTVGSLLIALLAIGYILIGMPGLRDDVASAPDNDATVQQQQPGAPAHHP